MHADIAQARLAAALVFSTVFALIAMPMPAQAQTPPDPWTNPTYTNSGLACNACHGNPATLGGNIDFNDATLLSGLSAFKIRISKQASNARMRYFGGDAAVSDFDRQAVLSYLINVRDGVVTTPAPGFTSTVIGSTSSATVNITIANYRSVAVDYVVAATPTGLAASDYIINSRTPSGTCSSTQINAATNGAAPSVCTIAVLVTFAPQPGAAGARNASIPVTVMPTTAGQPNPVDGSVSLNGMAVTAAPGFQISTTAIGLTAAVPAAATSADITITNPSTATGNLVLGSLLAPNPITGTGAAAFTLVAPTTNACTLAGQSLAPGGTCRIAVQFNAVAKGSYSATLSIPHNATGAPQAVTLNGTAQQGTVDVAASVALGNVPQGSTSSTTALLTNTGDASLSIGSKLFSGVGNTEFAVSGCTAALLPTLACTLSFTFTPSGTTPRSVTLALASNGSNAPTNVTVSGTGTALASPTVSSVAAFPSTLAGTTSPTTRTVTLLNLRSNPLDYATTLSGSNGSDFAISAESCPTRRIPSAIANAAGSCTLTLTYSPSALSAATARSGSLNLTFTGFNTDPSPAAQAVTLAGTAQIPAPAFSIASSTVVFSAVVGAPGTSTATITNSGTAALTLNTLSFGGVFLSEYAFAAGNTCTAGLTIPTAPGANTCLLAILFNPASATPASRDASLSIAHNATGSPRVLTLAGTATAAPLPAIDLGASTLAFGTVPLGSTVSQTVTVRNIGAAPLLLNALGLTGAAAADYTRGGTCTATSNIAVGGNCTVTLSFVPAAAGARTAVLTVASNASNTPNASVALSGDGSPLADPVVSPTPVSAFPGTVVGSTSTTTRMVTITNPRVNPLTYTRSITGAHALDFSIAGESCATRVIPGGGACTLTLQYTPAGAGTRTGTLNIGYTGFAADPSPVGVSLALSGTASLPTPSFSIASSALSFAAVLGTTPGSSSTLITNTGTLALSLSGLSFSGVAAAEFSLAAANTCSANTTLAPSTSCTLAVAYTPAAVGTSSASLSVVHNAVGSPQLITLSGTATPAPQGRIALGALSLTYPATQVGSASTQNITVQNTGDAPLTFSTFTVAGAAAADYTRGGTCSTATPLAVAARCALAITFQPAASGSRNATLTVQSDASNGAVVITLAGVGTPVPAPAVTLSTTALDFGQQTLNGLYPKRTVTVTNSGTADLSGIAVLVQGTAFSNVSTTACPATLAAGNSCEVDVAFTPAAAGAAYTGTLRVSSNATGSPHFTALSGVGTATVRPVLVWSPAATKLDFGAVAAGTPSAALSATLLNQGPGGVTLTLLNTVGAQGTAFSVTTGTCVLGQPIFEGQSCRIDVVFAPGSAGAKSATVQVVSTGSFPPNLALAGTGLGGPSPSLALSTAALSFDLVRVGAQSLPAEITLSGSGSGVVRVLALAATGPYSVQTQSCPAPPFSLPAGSTCTITVAFSPQAAGAAAGKLTVTSDADPAAQDVALSGNGEPQADLTGGGCSMARGDSAADPTLWLLLLGAIAALRYRRQARRKTEHQATHRAEHQTEHQAGRNAP